MTTFASLIKVFICLFKVSASGIPGVGAVPFGNGVLPIVFGSGMPGVGAVPLTELFVPVVLGSGMPGVELAVRGTGLVDKPGGKFAGVFWLDVLTAFTLILDDGVVEQAKLMVNKKENTQNKILRNIKINLDKISI